MRTDTHGTEVVGLALALALAACGGEGQKAGQVEQAAPGAEVAEEAAAPTAQPESGSVAAEAGTPPGAVAPAEGVEQPPMKNWMLIEFARPIEDADLEWLKQNGFRVDTVMSETTVRGWLEAPEGGEVIAKDPRVARIHAQMR